MTDESSSVIVEACSSCNRTSPESAESCWPSRELDKASAILPTFPISTNK